MMSNRHLNPAGLTPAPGGIYTHVVQAGNTVYIAGQLARDANGEVVGVGDVAAQLRQVWSNLTVALEGAGARLEDLVKTTYYIVGAENLEAVRATRRALALTDPPASTMVVVAGLADPRFLVEVDAIAVVS